MNTKEQLKAAFVGAANLTRELGQLCFRELGQVPYALNNAETVEIPTRLVSHAKLYANRYEAIKKSVRKNSRILEVGTQTGGFAAYMLKELRPAELHVIDINYDLFDASIDGAGILTKHHGYSSEIMAGMAADSFDMAYIDASHDYKDVLADLKNSLRIVRADGLIVCNDYTWYSPPEMSEYGVIRAVNEIVVEHELPVVYMAMQKNGYFDIAIKNIRR